MKIKNIKQIRVLLLIVLGGSFLFLTVPVIAQEGQAGNKLTLYMPNKSFVKIPTVIGGLTPCRDGNYPSISARLVYKDDNGSKWYFSCQPYNRETQSQACSWLKEGSEWKYVDLLDPVNSYYPVLAGTARTPSNGRPGTLWKFPDGNSRLPSPGTYWNGSYTFEFTERCAGEEAATTTFDFTVSLPN